MSRWPAVAVLALAGALALAGCGGSSPPDAAPSSAAASSGGTAPTTAAAQVSGRYVALGDSYSAAPGVPTIVAASGCIRSTHNYPHLIAAAVPGVQLTDVTCSGATTASLSGRQQTAPSLGLSVPPQLDALTAGTRYVTLGIGGNDVGLYAALVDCMTTSGCAKRYAAGATADIDTIGQHVTQALRAIHRKAPDAQVALVGYPQLVSASGSCRGLSIDPTDRAFVHGVFARLSQRMAQAAAATGAHFVDVLAASEGHDLCSADPWINGAQSNQQAFAFHPFLAEQQAVAALVVQAFS